ncbi:DUF1643 domain-containing protein [Mycolicibacterium canariasense]|uniref:DUF1643 domain-containing protein n=1 Tax=Mycolicibacterium canariasense TaxID=228230 RepID=UPI0032D57889
MTGWTGTVIDGIVSSAVISECGTYRYRLTRIWDESKPVLAWAMLNPSKADGRLNDPTIRRCIAFAKAWGYGGITVVNQYALRATDPKQLWQHPDPIGPDNDAELAKAAERHSLIILAWGSNATPGRTTDVLRILSRVYDRSGKLAVLGWTKGGEPRHPLYVRADTRPMRADIPPSRP